MRSRPSPRASAPKGAYTFTFHTYAPPFVEYGEDPHVASMLHKLKAEIHARGAEDERYCSPRQRLKLPKPSPRLPALRISPRAPLAAKPPPKQPPAHHQASGAELLPPLPSLPNTTPRRRLTPRDATAGGDIDLSAALRAAADGDASVVTAWLNCGGQVESG